MTGSGSEHTLNCVHQESTPWLITNISSFWFVFIIFLFFIFLKLLLLLLLILLLLLLLLHGYGRGCREEITACLVSFLLMQHQKKQ